MANILTKMIPDLYQSLDEVSRELVGYIPSVNRNASAARAAVGESVIVPVSTALVTKDNTPAMTIPEPDDFTVDHVNIAITKSKNVSFGLNGEEYLGLNNGVGANSILGENFKQAIRTLTNEIEADIAVEAAKGASRAFGTAGTTPFAASLEDAAQVRKMLDDNGTPMDERSLVINTSAGLNLRKLTQLTKANEAGSTMTLRQGELLDLFGLSFKESAAVATPAIGEAAGATLNAAEIGATKLGLAAGSGANLVAGDIITIAGDTNQYVVVAGAGNEIEIAKPGLRVAAGQASAVTVVAKSARNVAFTKNAIQLVTRAPALPGGRDSAVDSYMITDPRSGMTYEVRVYEGYRKMRVEVACAWGVKAIKPEHIVTLLG